MSNSNFTLYFRDNTVKETLCVNYHQVTRIVILNYPADGDDKALRNVDSHLLIVMTTYTRRYKSSNSILYFSSDTILLYIHKNIITGLLVSVS